MRSGSARAHGVALLSVLLVAIARLASAQATAPAPAPADRTITGGGASGIVGGLTPRDPGPARPAPRSPGGRVLLGTASPREKGVWLPASAGSILAELKDIPMQPWARALRAAREADQLEPHTRCKPSGASRPFLTPYGVEFVELPELQAIYIFDIGGPHRWRTIHMDGRTHPRNLQPSFYGHSIGWWEGDTLVIDTAGYNEGFWLDRYGLPHTTSLHTIERITRVDSLTMKYEITLDDPGAYTRPWTGGFNLRWERDTELFEYVCQQANYAHNLMVGQHQSVDRTSPIVP